MIERLKHEANRHRGLRPVLAGATAMACAAAVIACGDASDDAAKTSAAASAKASAPQATAAQPTTAQPTTAAQTSTAAPANGVDPAASEPTALHKAQTAKGTVRLGTLRLGYRGKLVVSPEGDTPGPATYHWYKPGTHVTIRAVDTQVARFTEWGGICHGRQRVCKVVMSHNGENAVAGFDVDPEGAKGLKADDPRLQQVLSD